MSKAPMLFSIKISRKGLAQKLFDVFNTLRLLLFVAHHSKGRGAVKTND